MENVAIYEDLQIARKGAYFVDVQSDEGSDVVEALCVLCSCKFIEIEMKAALTVVRPTMKSARFITNITLPKSFMNISVCNERM